MMGPALNLELEGLDPLGLLSTTYQLCDLGSPFIWACFTVCETRQFNQMMAAITSSFDSVASYRHLGIWNW